MAIDSADIVLMNSRLTDVSRGAAEPGTVTNIHENLFWAFFYNVICIPLATGLFSYKMNPMVGGGGHEYFQLHRVHECPAAEPVQAP